MEHATRTKKGYDVSIKTKVKDVLNGLNREDIK